MIEIYTKEACIYCTKAKEIMTTRGIQFFETPVKTPEDKQAIQERVGDIKKINTVPQFFKDGAYLGGYIDLLEYLAALRD